jgi:hypothetical protein
MYYRFGPPARGQKAFLATPVIGGLDPGYGFALFESAAALCAAGIQAEPAIYAGDVHVDDARNWLVRQFLMSDCTDLVFIDADIRWEARDLVALLRAEGDVVAATYPFKQAEGGFPVRFLAPDPSPDDGPFEVEGVPTGFLRIRRHVLERLAEAAPKYHGKNRHGDPAPLIFERTLEGMTRWGGDYTFCRKWRAMGGRIWLMPDAFMEHTGPKSWSGSLGHYLRVEQSDRLAAALAEIAAGRETNETAVSLLEGWGNNPWAATADLLTAAILLARDVDGPILECGSGATTLAMAAANPNVTIHALEHDAGWQYRAVTAAREHGLIERIDVRCAPLADGWYASASLEGLPETFALALVDGPPRHLGDRSGALRIKADRYLFDDANSPSVMQAVERLCAGLGLVHCVMGSERPFAIVYPPPAQSEKESSDEASAA